VVGLDAARQHAKEVLAKVQLGSDPQAEKAIAKAKALLTFQAIARRYLDGHASKKLKKSTFDDVERYLIRFPADEAGIAGLGQQWKFVPGLS
jgi:hypothetical protein